MLDRRCGIDGRGCNSGSVRKVAIREAVKERVVNSCCCICNAGAVEKSEDVASVATLGRAATGDALSSIK